MLSLQYHSKKSIYRKIIKMLQNPKKIRKKMRQKLKVGNNFSMSKGDS